jgi:2-polyprenyl-3-methyl-5-hydroxy-6-metoxy-1,4-benzoquinol methylase
MNNYEGMTEKEVWDKFGKELKVNKEFKIGPHFSYQLWNTPRHVIFTLSRYKFAAKLIGKNKSILEVGCSDGLGTYFLSEFASNVVGVDFDEEAIKSAQENYGKENLKFRTANILETDLGKFDAVLTYDVIEHIFQKNEDEFCKGLVKHLNPTGICFIGTPNITAQQYSNAKTNAAHVNMFAFDRLQSLLEKYFHNVFMFSQNDEMIHTGFSPMAHYLLAVCCHKKT